MNANPNAAAAPSAATATATPAAGAPSAPKAPETLADFQALAAAQLAAPESPATPPAAATVTPPAQESPVEVAPVAEVPAEPAPETPVETAEAEPTAEEQAAWTESEKRIHGALVKEREERKAAKAELKQVKDQLAELQKKLPADTTVAPVAPVTPAPAPSATVLGDCQTFEQVDARVMQAATYEAAALRMQQALTRNGVDAVLPMLAQHGIAVEDGNLVNVASKEVLGSADADAVGDFIANVFEGARATMAQASVRKNFLVQQGQAWQEATKILPELADAKSETAKRIAHFVQQNPLVRQQPTWPVTVAKLYLGEQAWNAKTTPPKAAAPKAAPAVPTRPLPGAPKAATAALPSMSAGDSVRDKIAKGTATLEEITAMTLADLKAS